MIKWQVPTSQKAACCGRCSRRPMFGTAREHDAKTCPKQHGSLKSAMLQCHSRKLTFPFRPRTLEHNSQQKLNFISAHVAPIVPSLDYCCGQCGHAQCTEHRGKFNGLDPGARDVERVARLKIPRCTLSALLLHRHPRLDASPTAPRRVLPLLRYRVSP